jgi:DNA-binding CsgD family transcriptional regulator
MDKESSIREYQRFIGGFECNVTPDDYLVFEKNKNLLLRLSEVENSTMAVFDMATKRYAFARTKFEEQIQYPLTGSNDLSPEYFFQLMPLPDLQFAVDTMKKGLQFLVDVSPSEQKDYKMIFEFRLVDPAGNFYRFLQQCVVLEQDSAGRIWLVLILNDLIPNRPTHDPLLRKLIHIPSGRICLFHETTEKHSNRILSKREVEILGLLSQGMQSKEISQRLFISVNTVNNHRQKIIEKLNTENTHEALTFAKQIGII